MAKNALVIGPEDAYIRMLRYVLARDGFDVRAATSWPKAQRSLTEAAVDIVIFDGSLTGVGGSSIDELLEAHPTARRTPTIRLARKRGARDVSRSRPGPLRVLKRGSDLATIERTVAEITRAADDMVWLPPERHNTVVVVGARGGSGKTSLAVNLAVALRLQAAGTVVLADLNLEFGTTAMTLGINPGQDASELIATGAGSLTDGELDSMLPQHRSGVRVLSPGLQPGASETVNDQVLGATLDRLRSVYSHVVIDARPSYRDYMLDLWESASSIVVPCPPDVVSIAVTRGLLRAFDDIGVDRDKVFVVANHVFKDPKLGAHKMESEFGRPVHEVPYDGERFRRSGNLGRPYVAEHPRAPAALALRELAHALAHPYRNSGLSPRLTTPRAPDRDSSSRQRGFLRGWGQKRLAGPSNAPFNADI